SLTTVLVMVRVLPFFATVAFTCSDALTVSCFGVRSYTSKRYRSTQMSLGAEHSSRVSRRGVSAFASLCAGSDGPRDASCMPGVGAGAAGGGLAEGGGGGRAGAPPRRGGGAGAAGAPRGPAPPPAPRRGAPSASDGRSVRGSNSLRNGGGLDLGAAGRAFCRAARDGCRGILDAGRAEVTCSPPDESDRSTQRRQCSASPRAHFLRPPVSCPEAQNC